MSQEEPACPSTVTAGTAGDATTSLGDTSPPDGDRTPRNDGSRYQASAFHARGNLGEIHRARDNECSREVALKTIRGDREGDPASRARFLREAEITAQLQHPGIVPVYGLGADDGGRPHYAMRFVEGETLAEAIRGYHAAKYPRNDLGPREEALRQLLNHLIVVSNAVAYAHSRGVIHRDLKPANIIVGQYGEVLVVDWGLARTFDRTEAERSTGEESLTQTGAAGVELTQQGDVVGTPAFMSPEQAAGRVAALGPPSDIYALGAILYAILTGEPPFREPKLDRLLARVIAGDFPPPRKLKSVVPGALDAICRKAMALRPEDRYATASELARDLARWIAHEKVTAWREPWFARAKRNYRKMGVGHSATITVIGLVMTCSTFYQIYTFHKVEEASEERTRESMRASTKQNDLAIAERKRDNAEMRRRTEAAVRELDRMKLSLFGRILAREAGRGGATPGSMKERVATFARPEKIQATMGNYLDRYEVLWDADWSLLARKIGHAAIVWEREPDGDGGRFVLMSDGETIRYIDDAELALIPKANVPLPTPKPGEAKDVRLLEKPGATPAR